MPCACGNTKTAASQKWVVTSASGTKTYSSEIEAKAAAQRTGGTAKRA